MTAECELYRTRVKADGKDAECIVTSQRIILRKGASREIEQFLIAQIRSVRMVTDNFPYIAILMINNRMLGLIATDNAELFSKIESAMMPF